MRADFLASIVVFLVALPLCMGVAIASGLPPAAGLITGIIGGLVVGFLQGSPLQVSGPAAGLSVIIWELVQKHGLATLGVIVLVAGFVQIVAGLAKGGRWFRAVPPSVIHGMLGGIGVLIFSSQFHVMIDDKPRGAGWQNLISIPEAIAKAVVPNASHGHGEAALTGVLTILIVVLWMKFAPKKVKAVPSALVGVLVASVLANLLKLPIGYVQVPDSLIGSATLPTTEIWRLLLQPGIWAAAVGVAVVASAETLLCSTAVDRMHQGPRTNYNRELLAQGVGNMVCGLLGALPMTGVIVRSTANVEAGAKTRRAAILHGAWILLLVVVFPGLLRLIPVSSLAAILVFTGYKLINPARVKELKRYGNAELATYLLTMAAIVATDLLKGVILGLSVAVIRLLLRMSKLEVWADADPHSRRTALHLEGSATFLRLSDLSDQLEQLPENREIHVRFEKLETLDHSILELLQSWAEQYRAKGGEVVIDWEALDKRYYRSQVEALSLQKLSDNPVDSVRSAP
ncbi:MAG: SulP family inorganic anion transporter [Archangium sp.]|nr:SulP family inorganic anion transporter [Archangium sp.]MDP3154835.1 SulP family inorganic anion transporter [Archangium sp.]MDP3575029.1 SulP family inorganic anion transporter [Archangium sp.]